VPPPPSIWQVLGSPRIPKQPIGGGGPTPTPLQLAGLHELSRDTHKGVLVRKSTVGGIQTHNLIHVKGGSTPELAKAGDSMWDDLVSCSQCVRVR